MNALFSRLTKRERFLFIGTITVVLGLGLYFLAAEPLYKKWVQLDLDIESANVRLFKNLKLLTDRELIEKEYNAYKDYIQKTDGGEGEAAAVLKEIEAVAMACGVEITSIKPKGTRQVKSYKKFTVEVVSEARLNQFFKFIYNLEGSKKLLKVERLILSLKGPQSDILRGTLIIRKISF